MSLLFLLFFAIYEVRCGDTIPLKKQNNFLQNIIFCLLPYFFSIFAIYEVTGGDTSEKKKKLLFGSNIREGAHSKINLFLKKFIEFFLL